MVQQCTDTIPRDYSGYSGVVPIQAYIRQLQQLLSQQDWDNEVDKAQVTHAELKHVLSYQEQSGSKYYPMF